MGCRWSGQNQTSMETLFPEYTGNYNIVIVKIEILVEIENKNLEF